MEISLAGGGRKLSIGNFIFIWKKILTLSLLFSNIFINVHGSNDPVTCGSVMKLQNGNIDVRLHSHDVKYGSGSGQQSVTATDQKDDINSHWLVKGRAVNECMRGEPIVCGSIIRLEHLTTNRNLHSHNFPSPLSNNQEVSAFGEKGEGDTGDLWRALCPGDHWLRDTDVRFKHVDTDAWLTLSGQSYGRPITGQMEVCATSYPQTSSFWKTAEGVFIKSSTSESAKIDFHEHSEL